MITIQHIDRPCLYERDGLCERGTCTVNQAGWPIDSCEVPYQPIGRTVLRGWGTLDGPATRFESGIILPDSFDHA